MGLFQCSAHSKFCDVYQPLVCTLKRIAGLAFWQRRMGLCGGSGEGFDSGVVGGPADTVFRDLGDPAFVHCTGSDGSYLVGGALRSAAHDLPSARAFA